MRKGAADPYPILAEMDAECVARWRAWNAIEPWGEAFDDDRFARLIAQLYTIVRGKTRDPREFLSPGRRRKTRPMSPKETLRAFKMIVPKQGIKKNVGPHNHNKGRS